jgi:hypothetical protein
VGRFAGQVQAGFVAPQFSKGLEAPDAAKYCCQKLPYDQTLMGRGIGLLPANGTDVKVQSGLVRNSNIGTTMNLDTQAVSEQKRAAHGQVVEQLLTV